MKRLIITCLIILFAVPVYAVDIHVDVAATGSDNGTDWTNAFNSMIDAEASVLRGDTIYIKDGTYDEQVTFNVPETADEYIYVQRAVDEDHGSDTGWVDNISGGQVIFTQPTGFVWSFQTGYWDVSGVSRIDTDSGHGIKLYNPAITEAQKGVYIAAGITAQYLKFSYVEIELGGWKLGNYSMDSFYINGDADNLTIQYCYFHETNRTMVLFGGLASAKNTTLRYNHFKNNGSGDILKHSEMLVVTDTDTALNFIIAYNIFENASYPGSTGYLSINHGDALTCGGYEIYGNLFMCTAGSECGPSNIIGGLGGNTVVDTKIYNNSFINLQNRHHLIIFDNSTGTVEFKNNLVYNCNSYYINLDVQGTNGVHSHNLYDNAAAAALEPTGQSWTGGSGLFADYMNNDFQLAQATDIGDITIGPEYSVDMYGAIRGADGLWDRGYDEFTNIIAAGLEVHRASYESHVANKMFVQVGSVVSSWDLRVTLSGATTGSSTIYTKNNNLLAEEYFVFDQRSLLADTYTITIDVIDDLFAVQMRDVSTYVKTFDNVPKWGIDENLNICLNGTPFFLISPFHVSNDVDIAPYRAAINTLEGVGFDATKYDLAGWVDYLDYAELNGWGAIGPLRGYYWPGGSFINQYSVVDPISGTTTWLRDRTIDIAELTNWVNAAKDHSAIMMYNWKDEPELGGSALCVEPYEVLRWKDTCHALDPERLVMVTHGGYGYRVDDPLVWRANHIRKYSYLTYQPLMDDPNPGGTVKEAIADVLAMDFYPFEYFDPLTETIDDKIEGMVTAMDYAYEWNANLMPFMSWVETNDIHGDENPGPTATELKMLIWANIVHGAKGIGWFHYFNPTPAANIAIMEEFKRYLDDLEQPVLADEYSGALTGLNLNAIDILATEYDEVLYIFAVNLSGLSDFVVIDTPDIPITTPVEVYDENRYVTKSETYFYDTFNPYEVHIYKIDLTGGIVAPPTVHKITAGPAGTGIITAGGNNKITQ